MKNSSPTNSSAMKKGPYPVIDSTKIGLMEAAQGSTLFEDEIGEMPVSMQVKLLRVIQDRKVLRLGSVKPIDLNIRIIAATNRELRKDLEQGRFRQDLYYRLKVVVLKIPPLRGLEKEDIPLLLNHFLEKFNIAYKKKSSGIRPGESGYSYELFLSGKYPGIGKYCRQRRGLVGKLPYSSRRFAGRSQPT